MGQLAKNVRSLSEVPRQHRVDAEWDCFPGHFR
jgi:hypothetical protein